MALKLSNFFQRQRREFESFQIEVSTYCSFECPTCPKRVFAEQWIFQQMSLETFQKISPLFPLTRWVSFQGWGDPLENENMIPMLRLAKQANCLASLTTPGILLTEALSQQFIDGGLDRIVVYLNAAGRPAQGNDHPDADSRKILSGVERLVGLKKRLNRKYPLVTLSLPVTRMNINKLPQAIPLGSQLGVDELEFRHLNYLPTEGSNILRTFYHVSPNPAFEKSMEEIKELGKKMAIPVKIAPLKAEEKIICEANPPKSVFFSVDGSVAPCDYLRIPKKGDIPRVFLNKEYRVPQTFFGNINQDDFQGILRKEPYQRLRKTFEDRRKTQVGMVQLWDAFSAAKSPHGLSKINEAPPPLPEVCQTCYKAYGV
jgi:MoaA/NifB/PqqE/SkfB family radical SAM enzyme